MKILHLQPRGWGFSFKDLLVVLAVAALVVFLFPVTGHLRAKRIALRTQCLGNLKGVGIVLWIWANEHEQKFPMAVSTNKGGSLELKESGEMFRHFLVLSNTLTAPEKVLACPADPPRHKLVFVSRSLSNSNISYFLGIDADPRNPTAIVSGDRNITGGTMKGALMLFSSNSAAAWGSEIHHHAGNIGLADGSAQAVPSDELRRQIQASTNSPIRLAIP